MPGITARTRRARTAKRLRAYKKAALAVVGDDLTCRRCGIWTERLQMHHVRSRAQAPELRIEASNLIPLCPDCHALIHAHKASL